MEKLNDENYAASAIGWWFMLKCNFDTIMGTWVEKV
jgi:hypothetical protein